MVSMKDIAELCHVSTATVSKALNGHLDIGEETRNLIRRKAEELGYTANAAARSLKTNRSYNLGVLFKDEGGRGFTHEYFAAVLESFNVEAASHGYDITFINENSVRGTNGYLRHCRYRGVDGVAVICANFFDPLVQEVIRSDIPSAVLDHVFDGVISVLSDNVDGIAALVRYAYENGHRRIAYVHGEPTSVTGFRLAGFHGTCGELGMEVPDGYIRKSRYYDEEETCRITKELLDLKRRPTCILFPDDFALLGGLKAIREAGLRIPEDISVMGYDGIVVSRTVTPPVTTYRQDSATLGKILAEKLIERIEHPENARTDRITVTGELITGGSVAKIDL